MKRLKNKVTLVFRATNSHSIAAGCPHAFGNACAEVALIYVGKKVKVYVQQSLMPLASCLVGAIILIS